MSIYRIDLGPLIVVSGPSGVGKTTLVAELLKKSQLPMRRAITATSRAPRPGEVPGVDYHFWTRVEFEKAIAAGQMFEYARVHGTDYYGTPESEVTPHRLLKIIVILVIDVQGAANVRRLHEKDHLSIFVMPPSVEILEARLRNRGTEDEAKVAKRLASAHRELAEAPLFHHRLVNDDLTTATRELENMIAVYALQLRST